MVNIESDWCHRDEFVELPAASSNVLLSGGDGTPNKCLDRRRKKGGLGLGLGLRVGLG